ncbi:MAG: response regulator transcription factor [Chloroflexota bacterium]
MDTHILLADDHAVLRAGLRLLLEAQPDLKVIGEASDGREAMRLAEELKPDLILLDLTMPGLSGMETLPALRKMTPSAKILILTMHDDVSYLRQALSRGASGYVLKKAADSELISAVRAVLRGEVYVQPSMNKELLGDLLPHESAATPSDPWASLSEREQEVITLVALGHTSAEIAERLSLSAKTVETYRARGMEKLNLRSRAALVQFAIAHGLLSDNYSS